MKSRWGSFLLVTMLCPALGAAPKQSKAPPPPPPGHRFLFVVETSAALSRLGHSTRQAVVDMIWSGFEGQMHMGDTYGLWTYDEEPHTGIFPMQTWNSTNSLDLASQAGRFLRDQSYKSQPRLDRLLEKLQTVIHLVKDVDVLIISSGDGAVTGTPFDEQINAAWRDKASDVREKKKPLVTLLVVRNGSIASWSVTLAGEPIRFLERLALAAPAPSLATNAPSKIAVATPSPPATSSPTVAIITEMPRKVEPSRDLQSSNAAAAAVALAVLQASVATQALAIPVNVPKTEAASPPAATTAPSPDEQRPPEATVSIASKPLSAAPQAESSPPEVSPSPLPNPPSENATPARTAAVSEAGPISIKPPVLMAVSAREPSTASRTASPEPDVTTELVAVAPRSLFSPVTMVIIGTALLLATLALIVLFMRRASPLPQPSFITQSIERAQRQQ